MIGIFNLKELYNIRQVTIWCQTVMLDKIQIFFDNQPINYNPVTQTKDFTTVKQAKIQLNISNKCLNRLKIIIKILAAKTTLLTTFKQFKAFNLLSKETLFNKSVIILNYKKYRQTNMKYIKD